MALSEVTSGTQTAVLDTEHTLGSQQTDDGHYQIRVDLNNMINGDVTILRWYAVSISGGTERREGRAVFAHSQENPMAISVPVPGIHGVKFTLEQTDGTAGRNFDWSLMKIA
jgi:hypothetical protein